MNPDRICEYGCEVFTLKTIHRTTVEDRYKPYRTEIWELHHNLKNDYKEVIRMDHYLSGELIGETIDEIILPLHQFLYNEIIYDRENDCMVFTNEELSIIKFRFYN